MPVYGTEIIMLIAVIITYSGSSIIKTAYLNNYNTKFHVGLYFYGLYQQRSTRLVLMDQKAKSITQLAVNIQIQESRLYV